MDLRQYFQKIRAIEATIPEEHAVVVSLETPDGGREGRPSEVSRAVAAKLIAQGKARLATEDETEEFRSFVRENKMAADDLALRERLQLRVLQEGNMALLRSVIRKEDEG